ncbi:hypothetical protein N0V93_007559 [Gnomoniopsis smithogilvyi]|uniref:DUF7053 domain-containing protein n=1 Tax=Gnomoniopsis smithogilvyi TaxID=1191159 RepID=A0A9W8YSX3_9PEZI|nr:hypothetical protein N0V93_007559 [Gnomoniopsis smithogilvyi]
MPATFDLELRFPLPSILSPDIVIQAIHAYEPLIRPNPYLQGFDRLPVDLGEIVADPFFIEDGSNVAKYEIHDRIPILPAVGWMKDVSFPAIFQSFPTGVRLRAEAAAGTTVRSIYGVERAREQAEGLSSTDGSQAKPGGGWALVERSHVECNALLKPFVQKQFEAGHRDLCQKVLDNLVAARQKSLPPLPVLEERQA